MVPDMALPPVYGVGAVTVPHGPTCLSLTAFHSAYGSSSSGRGFGACLDVQGANSPRATYRVHEPLTGLDCLLPTSHRWFWPSGVAVRPHDEYVCPGGV